MAWLGVVLVVQGCVSAGDRATAVHRKSIASGVCTIHRVELQRTTMYEQSEPVPADLEEYAIKAALRFPNVALGYSPKSAPYYRKAVVVRTCPVCERLFDRAIRAHQRSNQAMQLTGTALRLPSVVTSTSLLRPTRALVPAADLVSR